MKQQIDGIVHNLKETFSLPVFEDEIASDEVTTMDKEGYHCFVFETSEMVNAKDMKTIAQNVQVYYYSENRDDIDEQTIDVIRSLADIKGFKFNKTEKQRLQKKDTDRYIDRVVLSYVRRIIVGCNI